MIIVYIMNFLLAVSSTIVMSILPLLTTEKIGLSVFAFGLIEGSTEFLSNVLRLVSGRLFDKIHNKKNLFTASAAIAFLSKVVLFVPSALTIIISKILERFSNGLFAPPRDAFVGQNSVNKGLALGILSCSKTLGCVIGPLFVAVTASFFGDVNTKLYDLILIAGTITITAIILSFFLKTKPLYVNNTKHLFVWSDVLPTIKQITPILIVSILFFLGRFNDGMIMLYLKKSGIPEWFYLSTIGFFNIVMFVFSPILGFMIDRSKSRLVLFITIISLFVFNIFFSFIDLYPLLFASLGLVTWGIQRVGAQITFATMIFKITPQKSYGTAIGIYSLLSGIGGFIASSVCGYLVQYSFNYIFLLSGINSLICLIVTILFCRKKYF